MLRFLRETWETLRALVAIIRYFFVKWFLPLHNDDEEDEEVEERGRVAWFDLDETPDSVETVADTVPRQIEYSEAFPPPSAEGEEEMHPEAVGEEPAGDTGESDGDDEDTEEDFEEQPDDADRD